ncbi:Hypothetical predicted protein [Mytilus galloprovincialis]|uniref:Homeobox domain-containing protein n=1 Tax=Mytilus galloprovincialis TaxID=29158 RepID=A0A8B6GJB2_MYTGA|nr:Hypothetical predicted protein [Mytilus galloprovincialis]
MQEKVLPVNFQSEVIEETTMVPSSNTNSKQLTIDIPNDRLYGNFGNLLPTIPSTNQYTGHLMNQNLIQAMVQTSTDERSQNISPTHQMYSVQEIERHTSSSEEDSDRSHESAHNEVNSQVSLESRNEVKLASLSNCLNISPTNTSSTINRVGQSTNIRKQKKNRTTYSPSQVQVFERAFQENPYPDSAKIETLAIDLNIEEQNVKIWFQNKRARCRKRAQEKPQQHALPQMSSMMPPMGPYGMLPPYHPMLHGSPANAMPHPFFYSGYPFGMNPPTPASPATYNQQLPGIRLDNRFASSPTSSTSSPNSSISSPNSSAGESPDTTGHISHMHPNMLHLKQYMPLSYPYGMCPPFHC